MKTTKKLSEILEIGLKFYGSGEEANPTHLLCCALRIAYQEDLITRKELNLAQDWIICALDGHSTLARYLIARKNWPYSAVTNVSIRKQWYKKQIKQLKATEY